MNPVFLLAAFFLTVMGVITVAGYFLFSQHPAADGAAGPSSRTLLSETLLRVGEAVPSKPAQQDKYRRRLTMAGYRSPNAPATYRGVKVAGMLVVALLFGAIRIISGGVVAITILALLGGGGVGYIVPDGFLRYIIRDRSRRLLYGIPAVIDLLVLGLEAGQTLDAALVEAARELRGYYPQLAFELSRVQVELIASRSRPEVFRSLRDRNAEPELAHLAQVFLDSDRFGTSLAPALRTHVKFLRIRLRQQAYEKARKVGIKLVFPVFFLIFPAVILVMLGPAFLQIYTQLNALMR